jgi:hypothetical protein
MGNLKRYVVRMVVSLALVSAAPVFTMSSDGQDSPEKLSNTSDDPAEFLSRATVIPLSWGKVLRSEFGVDGAVKILTCRKRSSFIRALGISAGIQWMLYGIAVCGAPALILKGVMAAGVCGNFISWLYHARRSRYTIAVYDLQTGTIEARRVISRCWRRPLVGYFLEKDTLEIADPTDPKFAELPRTFVLNRKKGVLEDMTLRYSFELQTVRDAKLRSEAYSRENVLFNWKGPGASHSDEVLAMLLEHTVIHNDKLLQDQDGPVMRYLRSSPTQKRVVALRQDSQGKGTLCIVRASFGSTSSVYVEEEFSLPESLKVASVQNSWQICSPSGERFVFLQVRAPHDPQAWETIVVGMGKTTLRGSIESNKERFCGVNAAQYKAQCRNELFKKRLKYGAAVTITSAALFGAVALRCKVSMKS